MPRHTMRVLAVAAVVVVGTACGDDVTQTSQPSASTAPQDGAAFDQLPRFPRGDALSERTSKQGAITQSFRADGATVERVVEYYTEALAPLGWTPAVPAHRADAPGRADWVRDDQRLELSVVEIPPAQDGGPTDAVQYSLTLRPR